MKTHKGIAKNITNEIIGKITTKTWDIGKNNIYLDLANKLQFINRQFAAIISHQTSGTKIPTICLPDLAQLKEGDVVRINQEGIITVLIEAGSQTNAVIVNNHCNANCIMCPQLQIEADIAIDELKLILKLMPKSIRQLAFTGGEPTLDQDKLLQLITLAKAKLPHTYIEILTNAILLADSSFVKEVVDIKHPHISFHVPIYSDVSELHDKIVGTKGFYKTMQGLYNLATYNQQIEIRFVINKQTYTRMAHTGDFIYKNLSFASHIALMGNEYCGLSEFNADELWIDPIDYQSELEQTTLSLDRKQMKVSIYNHQLCTLRPSLRKFAKPSISDWKKKYLEVCQICTYREQCGGFFATSGNYISKGIKPLESF